MHIKGKTAVVTGGASGIGEGLVQRFHRDGAAHVVVVDRDAEGAKRVAESVGGTGIGLDVSDEAALRELVETTEREQGPIGLFVSNAGYVTLGGLEAPVEDLNRMWEVHVLAHLYAARAVIPFMADRGEGYLLNTASAAGLLSQFGSLHYAMTKHAAIALAEWIAITHGHQGIKVSVLCPQAVATNIGSNSPQADLIQGTGADVASGDGTLTPEDVADCVTEALAEERFHVLPHTEVREYVKRKGADVDRWIGGMQRWQSAMFPPEEHPATWLTGQ
ncbi:MAG: SDR family NAD(P)-dependent oxidoreductase [Acidimicrobiales bacterium]|jgi:NAD(P)-dependent dehydrogenase (short-subunit alcohol dehydrogenase family)|nr:SDR family NAD(P)-dependent oxidoreductase [Acidimicrobiales bacterium]